jgi:hypothetical protein
VKLARPLAATLLAATLFIAITPSLASAQSAPTPAGARGRHGTAVAVTTAPVIDGRLDDASWAGAALFDGFVQREPREGAAVSQRTEVRVLTDGAALYVGAWLHDGDAAQIVAGEKVRDGTLTNSDYFAFILDTYHDRQNGFLFGTTPAGIEHDAQVIREGEGGGVTQAGQNRFQSGAMGGVNINWDATWTVATSRDSLGWYAEFRIPFSTLRYGGGEVQSWGLNIMRGIRRLNEEALWSPVARQFSINRLSQAGTLDGIRVPSRRIATVTPYVLGSSSRAYATQPDFRQDGEVGLDAKYGLTPSLTLDLTYNTDFAQVEVDEQRTNLTRFPVFFPEKRPFFLENAGAFAAGTPQAVDLFFTRRIGIDAASGQPVPILGGGRLTGRVAGLTVGALHMVTDDAPGAAGNAYSVGRVLKEISARSRVGVIAVQRQGTDASENHNRVFGADARVGVGQDWTADAWAAMSETPGRDRDDASFSGRIAYQTRDWNSTARTLRVGEDFNPEVGFMSRPGGYRFDEVTLMRIVRTPGSKRVRQWSPHANLRRYVGTDGFIQSSQIHLDATELELNDGGRFGPEFNIYTEGLQAPFEISPGIVVPPGQYLWHQYGLDWSSDPSAPLSIVSRLDFGRFYTGRRGGGSMTVTLRQGASFTSALVLDYQDVRLPEGDFTRELLGVRLGYFFTPRIFLQSLTQYNNQAEAFTANLRFGWLNTANTGLYVVLNDGEQADSFTRWRAPIARSLTVKYSYQLGSGS